MTSATSAGGTASTAPGARRVILPRVRSSLRSGSCTAVMPRPFQAMPQRPMAVSKSVKPADVTAPDATGALPPC